MVNESIPVADRNGIVKALPDELSEENRKRLSKFGIFMFLYDFVQYHFVRPRLHKADPKRHSDILRELISPVRNSRVLDIACGTGAAIEYFASSNEYSGLGLSYSMLRQAVRKAEKKSFRKARLVQGNAEDLVFDDNSFDFVLMDTALHMIPDYHRAVSEVARVLINSCTFLCSTPAAGISGEFDAGWRKIADRRSLNSLTENDIKNVCSMNGLKYRFIDTNGGMLYFSCMKEN